MLQKASSVAVEDRCEHWGVFRVLFAPKRKAGPGMQEGECQETSRYVLYYCFLPERITHKASRATAYSSAAFSHCFRAMCLCASSSV